MFRRFITCEHSGGPCRREGIFHASYALVRRRSGGRAGEIRELLDWFKVHLPVPPEKVFSGGRAVCWFRTDSPDFRERLWTWVVQLRAEEVRVREVASRDPGLITYSDEHQVVAIPYSSAEWAR